MKKSLIAAALLLALPAYAAEGDATHGQALFKGTAQCATCHKLDHNLVGPQLNGVFGRKAGTVPSFAYSSPLKAANLTWDEATLDKWLTSPTTLVPGTHMTLRVEKDQDRADIIAYLKTLPKSE